MRRLALGVAALVLAASSAHGDGWAAPPAEAPARPDPDHKVEYHDTAMGTSVSVFLWTDDETKAAQAARAVFDEMKRLDLEMTTWVRPGVPLSDVAKVNAAAGTAAVVVSEETYTVIARALDVSRRSGGVFDITVGAFAGLWKFDEEMDGSLPEPAEVTKRLALIGWRDVVLDPKAHSVFLRRKGMAITLGGIAKGYAVDKCVKLLFDRGYTNFMVQAGGDMYVSGKKGEWPWMVAIRDPRGPRDAQFAVSPITDHSFSTSGDYERGFVKDGVRYHHILDPRNGFPAHASRSVTIRAKDAFTADAWSKVMFIYGWKAGMEIIAREKLQDFDAVWVDDANTIHKTSGIAKDLRVIKDPTPGI